MGIDWGGFFDGFLSVTPLSLVQTIALDIGDRALRSQVARNEEILSEMDVDTPEEVGDLEIDIGFEALDEAMGMEGGFMMRLGEEMGGDRLESLEHAVGEEVLWDDMTALGISDILASSNFDELETRLGKEFIMESLRVLWLEDSTGLTPLEKDLQGESIDQVHDHGVGMAFIRNSGIETDRDIRRYIDRELERGLERDHGDYYDYGPGMGLGDLERGKTRKRRGLGGLAAGLLGEALVDFDPRVPVPPPDEVPAWVDTLNWEDYSEYMNLITIAPFNVTGLDGLQQDWQIATWPPFPWYGPEARLMPLAYFWEGKVKVVVIVGQKACPLTPVFHGDEGYIGVTIFDRFAEVLDAETRSLAGEPPILRELSLGKTNKCIWAFSQI